jgi:hypothetical protein
VPVRPFGTVTKDEAVGSEEGDVVKSGVFLDSAVTVSRYAWLACSDIQLSLNLLWNAIKMLYCCQAAERKIQILLLDKIKQV